MTKKLIVIRAPGLSADQAVRGDMAWNVSDLIADGSFAALSGVPDVDAAVAGMSKDRVRVIDVPYTDAATFDGELGKVRASAADSVIAIVSESVFISQHYFRELRPGTRVAVADVPRLLEAMIR
jgi:hypothetical protein